MTDDEFKDYAFKDYRRTKISEMAYWEPGMDMTGVSVSEEDRLAGSPHLGDMIARNPANHVDKWLISEAYFRENFEELGGDDEEQGFWQDLEREHGQE